MLRAVLVIISIVMFVYCFRVARSVDVEDNRHKRPDARLDGVTGRDFEVMCMKLLAKHGYSDVTTVSLGCTSGIYVIAWKGGEKWMFRCWAMGLMGDTELVVETFRVAGRHRCSRCGIISTGNFDRRAIHAADCRCVKLVNRDGLIDMLNRAGMAA